MLHPPPTYKLKITNADEHDALVWFCNRNAYGAMDTFDLLARQLRFMVLAKEVTGKHKYTLTLKAQEALQLSNIIAKTLGWYDANPEQTLSPYNQSLYRGWRNDILKLIQTYYITKINA